MPLLCPSSLLMGEFLYLLPPPSLFSSMFVHRWLHISVSHIVWEGVTIGVKVYHFVVPSVPWSVLATRIPFFSLCTWFMCLYWIIYRKGFVCRTQYMFMWLVFSLHLLACVVITMEPFMIAAMVSRWAPVSIMVCHMGSFLTTLPGMLFLIPHIFLEYGIHLSSWIEFCICRGCQEFLANDCHVLWQSGICPDLQVHYFLVFDCHTFSLSGPFNILLFIVSTLFYKK